MAATAPESPRPGVMRSESGYIGSLVVHAALIGLAVFLARMGPKPEDIRDHDPLLLEVWPGDGSDRAPGIPGRDRGVAEGLATGDKSKAGPGGLPRMSTLNARSLIKTLKENEAQAAREAAEAKAKTVEKAKAETDSKSSKTSAKTETLDDFNKATGRTGKTAAKVGSSHKPSAGGVSGTVVGGKGTGKGTGADGFGRAGGKGQNGGDGGSGDALKLFAGDVRGKFADVFIPLFREQGGDLESSRAEGEVRVSVSPSGLVVFSGWEIRPSDAVVERLVQAAILKMKPVRPPPGGQTITLIIPVSGALSN